MAAESNTPLPPTQRLNGATRADRLACTAKIREIIVAECHGWISDFYQYSNTSLCLHFEIPSESLPVLRDGLKAAGIGFGSDAERAHRSLSIVVGNSEVIACTLQVTFIHSETDLRRSIPAVPG
jgi:hypothetical protein